ncbi:MAG TPA: hypothetical protein VMM93_06530, partial [Vicinamibacterales bacterium]|nr:hypothetical protein [Vicinamibacterales bacterium]
MKTLRFAAALSTLFAVFVALPAAEQAPPAGQAPAPVLRVEVTPATLTLALGESATLSAVVRDAAGAVVADARVVFAGNRRQITVSADGVVQAIQPGTHVVTVTALPPGVEATGRGGRGGAAPPNRVTVIVTVPEPAIRAVTFVDPPARFYAGTRVSLDVHVVDVADRVRPSEPIAWTSSDEAVARVDSFGHATLVSPGTARIVASTGGVSAGLYLTALPNPVATFEVTA